jgi:hypothetical protein
MNSFSLTISRILYAIMLLGFLTGTVLASDNVDFDHSVDFNNFHTFQLLPNPNGGLAKNDSIMDGRVQGLIRQHLLAQGLKEVKKNPDLIVSYDASTKENHVLNTVGMGPGMGPGMGLGWRRFGGVGMGVGMGGGMATTTVTTFTEGTLVIDAYTVNPKTMVWRGIAEESISDNPEKTTRNIEKSLDKLFKKWDKIKKKQYHD